MRERKRKKAKGKKQRMMQNDRGAYIARGEEIQIQGEQTQRESPK